MARIVEKGFMHAILRNGCLNLADSVKIIRVLCEKNGITAMPSVADLLKSINKDINQFGQCVTMINHPIVMENFVVFALTFKSCPEQIPTCMSEIDCNYFSKLLSTMVRDKEYSMHWAEVFEIADSLTHNSKKLSKSNAQVLFDLWSAQGYFLTKDEKVYFGPRLIVEFEDYLKMHYAEYVKDCTLCGKLVLWDIECNNCQTRLHRDCIRKYLRLKCNCPSCKKTWNTRISF